MKEETTIAKNIRISSDKARYDAACKQLLSEKIILAWIMKSCVEEFRDVEVKEIADRYIEGEPQVAEIPVMPDEEKPTKIFGMAAEDSSINEGTVTFDIRFRALAPGTGELISLILNIEAQNDFHPGYPLIKRAIYYCSRMISSQYGTEFVKSHYEKIRKVYSIWICTNPPVSRQNSITRYCIKEDNLVGKASEKEKNYDLLTAVMICLGNSNDRNYGGILKLLDVLLSNETKVEEKQKVLMEDFDIPMSQTLERKVDVMCNLSEGVWEKGVQQGIQQGVQQGIQQGVQQGIQQGVLVSIRNLMETMGWSEQKAMDSLKIPKNDQPMYAKRLSE